VPKNRASLSTSRWVSKGISCGFVEQQASKRLISPLTPNATTWHQLKINSATIWDGTEERNLDLPIFNKATWCLKS
jgi:hypothetical protein